MSWKDINENDYGWVGKLTIQQDGTAVDISGYTTLQMIFVSPSGTASTKTATFDSDGTDGVIKYTIADGDIDAAGNWKVFGRVSSESAEITTSYISFTALPRQDE